MGDQKMWGRGIDVTERPAWVADDDEIHVIIDGTDHWVDTTAGNRDIRWDLQVGCPLILRADHWAYPVLDRGFTPWAGGPEAPADWDRGEVLFRCGDTDSGNLGDAGWNWRRFDGSRTIIGYRQREPIPHLEPGEPLDIIDLVGPYSIGSDLWPGLSKLIEESGECAELMPAVLLARSLGRLVQLGGKVMQTGGLINHWSGDLSVMLTDEIGDLKAAIDFFTEKNSDLIDRAAVERRRFEKQVKFQQWHRENSVRREAQS